MSKRQRERDRILEPIDIIVVPGTSVTVVVPLVFLHNGKCFTLEFELTEAERVEFRNAEGIETVSIQVGVGGVVYSLLNRLGNVFYADRLRLCRCYRISFGNNGAPTAIQHFINFDTPCCARPFDPEGQNATAVTPG